MATPMLTGLMDHWTPSHDAVSQFWKTPFESATPAMASLCNDIGINNFTFYTKWMSNGVKSSLPFLRNHPQAQNVVTNNEWGRNWIDFFHNRGMTVGAMIQCYWWEKGMLPAEAVLRHRPYTTWCTGFDVGSDVIDPLWSGYDEVLKQMLEEHLRLFPKLDAVFLEFEGTNGPAEDHPLCNQGEGEPVDPRLVQMWDDAGLTIPPENFWIWTKPVQSALAVVLERRLAVAHKTLDALGFRGIRGVVYHALGFETPYIVNALPNVNWWLLPWHYWGWEDTSSSLNQRRQIAWCLEQWRSMVKRGYNVCYLGNATLPTTAPQTIEELIRACTEMDMAGYIGMGNPIPKIGLRWQKATDASVASVRKTYQKLFPPIKRR